MAIVEPRSYATEENVRIPTAGADLCLSISGIANFASGHGKDGNPTGSDIHGLGDGSSDKRWVSTHVHLMVGPPWNSVKDVSPMAAVTGFSFRDSDETDHTGFELKSCEWDTVSMPAPNQSLVRIRLKLEVSMCGGQQSSITRVAYHLVAVGFRASVLG